MYVLARTTHLRGGVAFVVDADGVPTAGECGFAVFCEVVEEDDVLRRCVECAFEGAEDFGGWFFDAEKMRRVTFVHHFERGKFEQRSPVEIVGVGEAGGDPPCVVESRDFIRDAWILRDDHSVVRSFDFILRRETFAEPCESIEIFVAFDFAALMLAPECSGSGTERIEVSCSESIFIDTCSREHFGVGATNAHNDTAEVKASDLLLG